MARSRAGKLLAFTQGTYLNVISAWWKGNWGAVCVGDLYAGGSLCRRSSYYRANSNILPKYLIPQCFFLSAKKTRNAIFLIILPFGTQDFVKKICY